MPAFEVIGIIVTVGAALFATGVAMGLLKIVITVRQMDD